MIRLTSGRRRLIVSDDRTRASADGKTFSQRRWSTPLSGHHDTDGRRVLSAGEGVWHAQASEDSFTYLEFTLDAISYNTGGQETSTATDKPAPAVRSGGW